jgi:hypothetical protein
MLSDYGNHLKAAQGVPARAKIVLREPECVLGLLSCVSGLNCYSVMTTGSQVLVIDLCADYCTITIWKHLRFCFGGIPMLTFHLLQFPICLRRALGPYMV